MLDVVFATQDNLNKLRRKRGVRIHAYKFVRKNGAAPYFPRKGLRYKVGARITTKRFDTNRNIECGEGLHVATLEWCVVRVMWRRWQIEGVKIIEVDFRPEDIVCVPYGTDGKFRVKRLRVLRVVPAKEWKTA
jgi:hypothetical protein